MALGAAAPRSKSYAYSSLYNAIFDHLEIEFAFARMCQQCNLSNIVVKQAPTGASVKGKNEYKVTVTNNCACVQQDLMLNCKGFDTTLDPAPIIFHKIDGETCVVNNGDPISNTTPITFNYAWDFTFDLSPKSSTVKC
ncbi:hypothetical protein Scep_013056 [Stephania cephalantha]|uniref:Uncharacterized protein n=1 Tax=Stephania cephalantha TaxID=152367 RepID=A0AAP0JGA2_9MAGN